MNGRTLDGTGRPGPGVTGAHRICNPADRMFRVVADGDAAGRGGAGQTLVVEWYGGQAPPVGATYVVVGGRRRRAEGNQAGELTD